MSETFYLLHLLLHLYACLCIQNANGQLQCTIELLLENRTLLGNLAEASIAATQGNNTVVVTVIQSQVVCLATGNTFNQERGASIVLNYNCSTCPGGKDL